VICEIQGIHSAVPPHPYCLDKIPYSILIIAATFMILAPFKPMPHVLEKLKMLKNGTLTKPIDIFDLFYHLIPPIISLLKGLKGPKCIKITSWKFPALSGQ